MTSVTRRLSAWYFVVPIVSIGLLAVIPFVHAAVRLRRRPVWTLAAIYGAVDVALLTLSGLAPTDGEGNATSATGEALLSVAAIGGLTTAVVACVQLSALRREVYGLPPSAAPPAHAPADPAVAEALAARARREEARKLAADDPALARDLLIGRPDLARSYDDGGLVDINNAPASAIASTCGIDQDSADRIVEARATRGGFSNVAEVLVLLELPTETWDRIRHRAIVLG